MRAKRKTYSLRGKQIGFLITQRGPGASFVLWSHSCSPAGEKGKVERRGDPQKALECRVHSVPAAPAALCQGPGISLPVSKPVPAKSAAPWAKLDSLLKGLLVEGCTVWEAQPAASLPPCYWDQQHQEERDKDGAVRAAGACMCVASAPVLVTNSGSGGSRTCWEPEWELEREKRQKGEEGGCSCSGRDPQRLDGQSPPALVQYELHWVPSSPHPWGLRQHKDTKPPRSSEWACRWDPTPISPVLQVLGSMRDQLPSKALPGPCAGSSRIEKLPCPSAALIAHPATLAQPPSPSHPRTTPQLSAPHSLGRAPHSRAPL